MSEAETGLTSLPEWWHTGSEPGEQRDFAFKVEGGPDVPTDYEAQEDE